MTMKNIITFVILAFFCSSFQDQWKNVYTESAWKDRDRWQRANDLIRAAGIKSGSYVADIGSHEGYMTFKLSTVVGESGRVYAVDVDQHKLDKLAEIAKTRKVMNIATLKGDYDDPKLPPNSLDAAIILDTYHEMKQHDTVLAHVKAALRNGGSLVICEPIADERRALTRIEQEGKHELGIAFAVEDLMKAGFKILRREDPFVDRTQEKGDKMWLLVAVKPK